MLRLPGVAIRLERRAVLVSSALAALAVVLAVVAMSLGEYDLSALDVARILSGASDDALADYFVKEVRLPRVVAAVAVGAALGASGGIFQSMSGNPLGSPDIIGFTTGSATGALLLLVAFAATPDQVALGALFGGLTTAGVVYALSYRRGVAAIRLVLVGVGVGAMLQAANALLVVRASLPAAQAAAVWLAGSLNSVTWTRVALITAALAVLLPVSLALAHPLKVVVLGDAVATGVGVRVERTRLALVLVGVALVAIAVATAGPIAFVALAAPQLAVRLTRSSGIGLGSAALMGAVLVLGSDIVAQRIFAPTQLPVGVVTGTLGGTYLIWLLVWRWRRQPT